MTLTQASYSMINSAPVSVIDYGADPTGVADSTAAIQAAINYASPIRKKITLASGKYKISSALEMKNFTYIDGEGGSLLVNADVPAIDNSSGSAALYVTLCNLRVASLTTTTSSAISLRDISRSTLRNILIDRETAATSFAVAVKLKSDASVCYWNEIYNVEATNISSVFISVEGGANDNYMYGVKLVNDTTYNVNYGINFDNGTGNRVFGASLEAQFGTPAGTVGYIVNFNGNGDYNTVVGIRTETFVSGNCYGVRWNGGTQNVVIGHYNGGTIAATTGDQSNNVYIPGSDSLSAPDIVAGVAGAADGQFKLARTSDGAIMGSIEWKTTGDIVRYNNANGGRHEFDVNDTEYFAVKSTGVQFVNHTVTPTAGALQGYIQVDINGTARKIPYYATS